MNIDLMFPGVSWITATPSSEFVVSGGVWELDEHGARLLHAAGTPGEAAWLAENSTPHDLKPLEPSEKDDADIIPDETPPLPPEEPVKTDPIPDEAP